MVLSPASATDATLDRLSLLTDPDASGLTGTAVGPYLGGDDDEAEEGFGTEQADDDEEDEDEFEDDEDELEDDEEDLEDDDFDDDEDDDFDDDDEDDAEEADEEE